MLSTEYSIGLSSVSASSRSARSINWPIIHTWCSTIFTSTSMPLTSLRAGSRRLPGGWKWTPLGASRKNRCVGRRRHSRGGSPYARANARVNASCEPYPASIAMSSTPSSPLLSRYAARSSSTRRRNDDGDSPVTAPTTRSKW
jgi:hypothetical protein